MERFYLAALQLAGGVGLAGAKRLLEHFGTAEAAWRAPAAALAACLPAPAAASLGQLRRERPSLHEEIAADCQRKQVALCIQTDAEYPPLLKQIFNPPLVLFYRGTLQPEAHRLAIVGSRRFSPYGKSVAEALAMELARSGATVVSGAARGIDSAAHRGALQTGRTVAVLGCGVDVVYPPENRKLLDEIAEAGAVISEYVPGTQPLPVFFPTRNRIISGLAHGTVVVEAAERSGSLITAEMALSEGRDVFAVPGSIYSVTSQGCNQLIQQGAKLITRARDVLEEYAWAAPPAAGAKEKAAGPRLSPEEKKVYALLSYELPQSVDDIICQLHGSDASNVAFLLLQMELRGLIVEDENHAYLRAVKEGTL